MATGAGLPAILVLASGRGERFRAGGGETPKLQAPLAGVPVLDRTLAAVAASGLPWHLEEAGHPGMGESIAAAVRASGTAGGWLILPADLPLVSPATLRAVAGRLANGRGRIVVPRYYGRRGHPVAFPQAAEAELLALRGDRGARAVVQRWQAFGAVDLLELDDPGILVDIDTPADLAFAERHFAELCGGTRTDFGIVRGSCR